MRTIRWALSVGLLAVAAWPARAHPRADAAHATAARERLPSPRLELPPPCAVADGEVCLRQERVALHDSLACDACGDVPGERAELVRPPAMTR